MAPTLQDFNKPTVQQMRMDAFQPKMKPSPAANADTINLLATYGAALSTDGDIDGVYSNITNQLSYSTSSNTLDQILNQWKQNDIEGSMDVLRDVMVDPNFSDEEKYNILYGFQTGQQDNRISYNVAKSALMSADGDENGEQEDVRIRISDKLDQWDSHNAWVQNTLNTLNSGVDPQFSDHVSNLITSIIPFADAADQAFFESTLGIEGTGGVINTTQTLLLLGEGKERLRKTMANIPLDQRQAVIQNIINVIKNTSGAAGDDALAIKQIAMLESMIVPGAYGNTDRWVDNIFSVLDDTILLSPVSRVFRGIRGAVSAVDDVRVADQIIARGERAAESATDVPRTDAPLMIEYKPEAVDWTSDVDNIIDSLPIESTSADIGQLRTLINEQINKGTGFSIDDVINEARITDNLNSTQINDLRQNLGVIRDKRSTFLNDSVIDIPPTINEVRAAAVSSNVSPKSVSQIYKDTNPSKAQVAHTIVVNSDNDQAAKMLYGTTRQNAMAHDYLPNIGGNGRVENKVQFTEADSIPDQRIMDHVRRSEGFSWADAAEKAAVQQSVIADWRNGMGLSNRSNMADISDLKIEGVDTGVSINQVYGPKKGGFSNAFNAIDTVRAAMRKYGVADNELTILSRQADGSYAPAQKGIDLTNGDFLVQVKYDYTFDPKDVNFQGYDISPFWKFLQVPDIKLMNKEGGIVQQVIPKSVNIDPRAFVPGVASADRTAGIQKQLLRNVDDLSKRYSKLSKDQQIKTDEYIRIANEEQLPFSIARVKARGINDDGVEVLARWKQIQDTLHELENTDAARTLRDRGYLMFEHRASDTRLIVEEVPRTTIPNNSEIYDVTTDTFITLSRSNIDELYEKGGAVMKLRRSETINGRDVEFILSPNDGHAFSRAIRDDDRILNYRHGYYHVRYTDPYYITKTEVVDGKTVTKVVGRAEGARDARTEVNRLNDTKDGSEYSFRRDRNAESFDNHLDVAINTGRSAQRIRGQRLERVKGANDKTISDSGIESPADSLIRSISSISHRVAFRNVIDAERRRWMSQFKDVAPVKAGRGPSFPESVDEILDGPLATQARHAYRHVEQLSDGYGNMMDDIVKGFLNDVSAWSGSKGWGWTDKLDKTASKLARGSISGLGRLTAFRLFLASNPMRQLPLQSIPAIPIISALNPLGWPKVLRDANILASHMRGVSGLTANKLLKYGDKADDIKALVEDFELSGMSAAVNAHSFVADDLGRFADRNMAQRALSIAGKPLRFTQKIGFDLGEQTLMTLVWLSERDRFLRANKKTRLSPTDRDQVVAKARALTGDMNRGGDMPYNSNSFSVIMQFMQTPHKIASSLILGHTGLTSAERLKLAAGYVVAFGVPMIPVIDQFVDKIIPPESAEARDIIKGGLTNMVLNNMLSSLSGEKVAIDFSGSVQPFTLEPLIDMVGNLMTMNMAEFVQDRAAVSLIADSGRIHNFVKATLDWIAPGNYENVDELKQVGITAMQMFSGLSNIYKAMLIQDMGKITTASGQTVDQDVSWMETLMKAAGFQTMDEVYYWKGNMTKWEIDDKIQSDIETLVDNMFTKLTREGFDVGEWEQYVKIMQFATTSFKDNPRYLEKVKDYYTMKMRAHPDALYRLMMIGGLYTRDEVIKVINNSNFTDEQRRNLMEMHRIVGDSYGD
jgi:enamine deaminase RidA (YjgF/YER057c/UK114 family)